MATPTVKGLSAPARAGPRFAEAEAEAPAAAAPVRREHAPGGKERSEQPQQRRQGGDPTQRADIAAEPIGLDAVYHRHRPLEDRSPAAPSAARPPARPATPGSGSVHTGRGL